MRRTKLDPTALAELDAVDAALRGEAVHDEHAELVRLVGDVRASAPLATPVFLAELDARVREGFPPRDEAPDPVRKRPRWRPRLAVVLPATGAIAAALVALVVVIGTQGTGELASEGGSDSASSAVQTTAAGSTEGESTESPALEALAGAEARKAAGADSAAPAPAASSAPSGETSPAPPRPPADNDTTLGRQKRSVERSATLDLTVPRKDVQTTADGVVRATDQVGGIVQGSSIDVGADAPGEATFELRIPAGKLDAALAALSKLGSVANRTQASEDITGTVVSAEDRVADARAERRGLLRALGRADTDQELAALRARLRIVRADIARREASLRAARNRADLATVAVTVRGDQDDGSTDDDTGWSIGDAARDAGHLLETGAGVAIVAGAVMIPLFLLALAAGLASRAMRGRRRERILDGA